MSAEVLKFQKNGTPRTLLENALEQSGDYEFTILVSMRKDGNLNFHWSQLPSNLAAIGAVEFLKQRLMGEI